MHFRGNFSAGSSGVSSLGLGRGNPIDAKMFRRIQDGATGTELPIGKGFSREVRALSHRVTVSLNRRKDGDSRTSFSFSAFQATVATAIIVKASSGRTRSAVELIVGSWMKKVSIASAETADIDNDAVARDLVVTVTGDGRTYPVASTSSVACLRDGSCDDDSQSVRL